METVTTPEPASPRRAARIGRFQIGLNVLIQVLLVVFVAAMVNGLAFRHYKRWDFSRDKRYALSDKTKRFLDSVKGKIKIIVFFAPNTAITGDVQNLLTGTNTPAAAKSMSSMSTRTGTFPGPRKCSINTKSSVMKACW